MHQMSGKKQPKDKRAVKRIQGKRKNISVRLSTTSGKKLFTGSDVHSNSAQISELSFQSGTLSRLDNETKVSLPDDSKRKGAFDSTK